MGPLARLKNGAKFGYKVQTSVKLLSRFLSGHLCGANEVTEKDL